MINNTDYHDTLTASLLLEDCDGRVYDRRRKQFSTTIKVERGHILCLAVENSNDMDGRRYRDAYWEKELSSKSNLSTRNVLFMKCLEFGDVYLRVPKAKVALLTSFEALLLKAIRDVDFRFRFHQDRDLFNFVCQLQIGHRVVVQVGIIFPAKISPLI
ncbi:unnamed protein product [Gongylonema pulchrum]|uniref:WH1 domain-containing protein n=1 Tax=Gongylonema pulchrum TaxID=637853 RepID=A0A183EHA8_9BILA|nr:unnamed protein product [Gongylonema pulchrum]